VEGAVMLGLVRGEENQRRGTSLNQVSFDSFNIVNESLFSCRIDHVQQAYKVVLQLKCWRERFIKRWAVVAVSRSGRQMVGAQTPGPNLQHIAAPARF
jgi:hypothetical protein